MHTKKSASPRHTPDLTRSMAKPEVARENSPPEDTLEETLTKHGITRVSVDHFYTGGFHYTNLDDAIAQTRRAGSNS